MKLITEVYETIEYISEANENGEKEYFIEGIFMQANKKNRNGRMYPTEVLEREVDRYNKEYVVIYNVVLRNICRFLWRTHKK